MIIGHQEIMSKINIPITGCLHIGAHDCEELSYYSHMGVAPSDVLWIEAIPSKVQEANAKGIPNVYHATISDEDDKVITFHISNNLQSSSILEFGTHAKEHPEVFYVDHIKQSTITIDTFFDRNNIDVSKYNFWTFDIQGAELLALKGASQTIKYAKAIYLEVNEKEVYKNCGLLPEVDAFLSKHNFKRVSTLITRHGWGDALYIKDSICFDIGANIGNWSLSNINNFDKIIAIEASPITFKRLESNCSHSKITLLNYAVCNSTEDVSFYQAQCDVLSTMNKEWLTKESSRFYNHPYREIRCVPIRIDALIEKYGIPSLIKIDVEGGEYDCITSLTCKAGLLCFEWASEVNDITFKCLDYLFSLGYINFFIQNEDKYTFRPDTFYDITTVKELLLEATPKEHWGMIWCK